MIFVGFSELIDCDYVSLSPPNEGPRQYLQLTMRADVITGVARTMDPGQYKKPRVKCDTEDIAKRVNYTHITKLNLFHLFFLTFGLFLFSAISRRLNFDCWYLD